MCARQVSTTELQPRLLFLLLETRSCFISLAGLELISDSPSDLLASALIAGVTDVCFHAHPPLLALILSLKMERFPDDISLHCLQKQSMGTSLLEMVQ